MSIPDVSNEQLRAIISQEWSCLDKMLIEAGFKQEGFVCGCLPRYVGTREALGRLSSVFRLESTSFQDQTYFHFGRSKIITQPEGDYIIAWKS